MSARKPARRAEWLAESAAQARAQSQDVMAAAVRAARQTAMIEDEVADTLERLAETHPHDTARLRPKAEFARAWAAAERRWAEDRERDFRRPG